MFPASHFTISDSSFMCLASKVNTEELENVNIDHII